MTAYLLFKKSLENKYPTKYFIQQDFFLVAWNLYNQFQRLLIAEVKMYGAKYTV